MMHNGLDRRLHGGPAVDCQKCAELRADPARLVAFKLADSEEIQPGALRVHAAPVGSATQGDTYRCAVSAEVSHDGRIGEIKIGPLVPVETP